MFSGHNYLKLPFANQVYVFLGVGEQKTETIPVRLLLVPRMTIFSYAGTSGHKKGFGSMSPRGVKLQIQDRHVHNVALLLTLLAVIGFKYGGVLKYSGVLMLNF